MIDALPLVFVFLRRPDPGKAKTRLARAMGDEQAALLYKAMAGLIVDQLRPHAGRSLDVCLYTTPAGAAGDTRAWLLPDGDAPGFLVLEQPEGNLTPRLEHAAALAREQQRPAVAFIGSDCPHFFSTDIIEAFQLLVQGERSVLGPCDDGGFWLLTLESAPAGLFDGIPWSSGHTGEAMRTRLEALGLRPRNYHQRNDIDEHEDLATLPRSVRERLAIRARALGVTAWP